MTTTFVNKNTSTQLIPPKFSELFFLVYLPKNLTSYMNAPLGIQNHSEFSLKLMLSTDLSRILKLLIVNVNSFWQYAIDSYNGIEYTARVVRFYSLSDWISIMFQFEFSTTIELNTSVEEIVRRAFNDRSTKNQHEKKETNIYATWTQILTNYFSTAS